MKTKADFVSTEKTKQVKAQFDGLQAPTQIQATVVVDKQKGK